MTESNSPITLRLGDLREFGRRAYEHAGLNSRDASTVVDVQLEADLRGVDTHGYQRLPSYVERLLSGKNKPNATVRVDKESSASLAIDGDNGLGQLVCVRAMELTLAKASVSGLAVATIRNSNDWGCGAYYPMMAAREGYVAFCTTTSVPTLAPYGGRDRLLGNNPFSFAAPRRAAPPVVLDMALTPVALGKVMRASAEGTAIPLSWGFLDRDGNATTDPRTALRGIIPAIGGYKGPGLSVMANVLAGVLSGGSHTGDVDVGKRGQFFLVLSPELFGDVDSFAEEIENMVQQIKASDLLPGIDEVYLPGEIEQRGYEERIGCAAIPYPRSVVDTLKTLAGDLGIDFVTEGGST